MSVDIQSCVSGPRYSSSPTCVNSLSATRHLTFAPSVPSILIPLSKRWLSAMRKGRVRDGTHRGRGGARFIEIEAHPTIIVSPLRVLVPPCDRNPLLRLNSFRGIEGVHPNAFAQIS